MALEKVGLGGVLQFDEKQAVRGMGNATRASKLFSKSFNQITNVARAVGQGMGQLAGSMRSFGVAALPVTAAMGFGTKQAIDFEKQMSAVRAITGATAEDMARLEKEAKKQGATTAFSATQAGEGMEFLSRAGFSVNEQISAIGPLLNAAAADGIGLAETANIVANSLRAMNMPAEDASRVADVLALTSAKTNTNILQMGEAMRYAAPQAKSMNVEFEQLSAVLGAAADAGLQGSIGGTSFTQAMVKLLKPSEEGARLLSQYNVQVHKTATGYTDVIDLFGQVSKGIKSIRDPLDQARAVTELFGVRGQKAINAVLTAIESGKMEGLAEQLYNAEGSAERMAKIRLDNVAGSFTLLKSAAEGFALETAGLFLGPMKEGVDNFTSRLSDVVLVLQELNSEEGLTEETSKKAGSTIVEVAKGIKEGLDTVIEAWRTIRQNITDFIAKFSGSQSPDMIKQFTKIATIMFVVAGAIAPVLLAVGGLAFFISSALVPAFSVVGSVIGAVFGGVVLPILAVLGGAFLIIRKDGETVGQTFARIWEAIKQGFDFVMENAVNPFIAGFQYIPNVFSFVAEKFWELVDSLRTDFYDVINAIKQAALALMPFFQVVWTFIGNVVGVAVAGIGLAFTTMFEIVKTVVKEVKFLVISLIESIVNLVKNVSWGIGKLGELAGFDWGKKMVEFGKDTFKVELGTKQRGLQPPEKPSEISKKIGEEQAKAKADEKKGDMKALADEMAKATKDAQPKCVEVNNKMSVDGKTLAKSSSRHRIEIQERSGFKATPWQRRAAVEHGAAPVGGV